MIERVLTKTKVYIQDTFSADELNRVIIYLGGFDAKVAVIQDNRDFAYRDFIIDELHTYRQLKIVDKVFPDPKVEDIMSMVDELKDANVDVIIGIGGGSALDSAKAVAMILSNGGDLEDYLGASAKKTIDKKEKSLILIPTTAGTGSELTKFGVYTSRTGRKYTLKSDLLQADLALLITQLTLTMPPKLTAATGFDALSHALETLWNKNATPVSNIISIDAAVYIMQWLESAYDTSIQGGREGRKEMMMGAAKAGIAFNLTGTAADHALSFVLSEEWHIPHGAACAMMLEDILLMNSKHPMTAINLGKIGRRLFGDGSDDECILKLINKVKYLKQKMQLPMTFADLGITVAADEIPKLFDRAFSDPKMKNNIIDLDKETVFKMLIDKIK